MAKLNIAIIAGEASGDILGAGLIRSLKQRYPDAEFHGIGGDLMIAEGCHSLVPIERLSVMGLVEVLGRLAELLLLRRKLIRRWLETPPDLFIGIDAPDFNLTIEGALKQAGVPTVHYVSPSVWAWKSERIYKIINTTDLVLALFPFEAQHYLPTGQRISYVGHRLAEIIPSQYSKSAAKEQLGFDADEQIVALLPGSRGSEVKYLAPLFFASAERLLNANPKLKFVVPAANQQRYESLKKLLDEQFPGLPVTLLLKQSREAMMAADAVLIASGTATLEATLLGVPMVVAYKMSWLTHAIYSRKISAKFVSLPNLLAGEKLVEERIQDAATPEQLAIDIETLLASPEHCQRLVEKFSEIHKRLNIGSDERAAEAVTQLLEERGFVR